MGRSDISGDDGSRVVTDELAGLGDKAPDFERLPVTAWCYWGEVGHEIFHFDGRSWTRLIRAHSKDDAEKVIREHNRWIFDRQ